MLAYVIILAPAVTGATVALLFLVSAAGYYLLWKPFLDRKVKVPRNRVTGFLSEVTSILPRAVKKTITRHVKEHVAALLRAGYAGLDPAVVVVMQLEDLTVRTAGTLGDMSEQIYTALWTLNHVTVPRKITAALIPVKNVIANHTGRLDTLEDLNRRVAVEVGDTLRALPWGVPGGYVTNWATFLGRFVQLWNHYYDVTRAQLQTLLADTIPQIRQDVSDLSRRLDVQIDARLDALGNRLSDLERWRENVVMPRLEALTAAVDLLSDEVFGAVAGGLTALLERVQALETAVFTAAEARFAQLEADLAQLRLELEQGIETGLEAFRVRIEALETAVTETIPAQLAGLQLAIDTLAAEVFTQTGAGLALLTQRMTDLEAYVFGELRPIIDLAVGRIDLIEAQLRDDVLPRLRALEDILAPAAFAALIVATMRTRFPNLFCNNVTQVTQRICATDEAFWAQLLAGTLLFALALDPRVIARAGQEVTQGLESVWRETALR